MPAALGDLDALLTAIRATAKYAAVSDALITRIGAQELARRKTLKDAIAETRNKLHQVAGLYQPGKMRYAEWLEQIATDPGRETLARIMAHHSSTRERLPLLGPLYEEIFAGLPPVRSVLDVACGLNPLAVPWMPLAPGARYHALDVYADMMTFLGAALPLLGLTQATCMTGDALQALPPGPFDLALVLKTLPCLEQVNKDAGARLLDTINAAHIVVSYPTRSVGGRDVGMARNYTGRFETLIAGLPRAARWRVERIEIEGELVFRIETK